MNIFTFSWVFIEKLTFCNTIRYGLIYAVPKRAFNLNVYVECFIAHLVFVLDCTLAYVTL